MVKIVISEFMYEVFADRLDEFLTAVADGRALIVPNCTQVDAQLVVSANLP